MNALKLQRARDSNGQAIPERYTRFTLDITLSAYRRACAAAHAAVHEQLVLLAQRLEVKSSSFWHCMCRDG